MSTLEIVDNRSALLELTKDWRRLNHSTPMQSPEWLQAWWDAFQTPQDRLCVAVVRDTNLEILGIAPFFRRTSLAMGRTIRFLGSDRACSDFQTLLCHPSHSAIVVEAVVGWLNDAYRSREPRHRWDLLDLDGVSATDSVMNLFIQRMAALGHVTHRRDGISTWRINLEGWQGVLQTQSKSQRGQLRNFVNRFDKNSDMHLRFASASPGNPDPFIEALIQLHQMRWQAEGMDGCFADSRMKDFFWQAMRSMIANGSADITILDLGSRPVAAQAWMMKDKILFGYQCGRDPADDSLRVGRIKMALGLRWAAENGFEAIDYLRGDEVYKRQLRATPTPCLRVRIVARAGASKLRHNLWLACREVKSRWNRLSPIMGQDKHEPSGPADDE